MTTTGGTDMGTDATASVPAMQRMDGAGTTPTVRRVAPVTVPLHGRIEVSSRAIATIAGRAVSECYGVVGVAARHPRLRAVELLPPEDYTRGVEVRFARDHVTVDVYVALEYGLRITEVASNIMDSVKFAVERALGLHVVQVNVNVQSLRVSDAD